MNTRTQHHRKWDRSDSLILSPLSPLSCVWMHKRTPSPARRYAVNYFVLSFIMNSYITTNNADTCECAQHKSYRIVTSAASCYTHSIWWLQPTTTMMTTTASEVNCCVPCIHMCLLHTHTFHFNFNDLHSKIRALFLPIPCMHFNSFLAITMWIEHF